MLRDEIARIIDGVHDDGFQNAEIDELKIADEIIAKVDQSGLVTGYMEDEMKDINIGCMVEFEKAYKDRLVLRKAKGSELYAYKHVNELYEAFSKGWDIQRELYKGILDDACII